MAGTSPAMRTVTSRAMTNVTVMPALVAGIHVFDNWRQ